MVTARTSRGYGGNGLAFSQCHPWKQVFNAEDLDLMDDDDGNDGDSGCSFESERAIVFVLSDGNVNTCLGAGMCIATEVKFAPLMVGLFFWDLSGDEGGSVATWFEVRVAWHLALLCLRMVLLTGFRLLELMYCFIVFEFLV